MFEIFQDYMDNAETLVTSAAMLTCIAGVVVTYSKTKALVPTVGAVLLGAIVMFGVTRFDELGREIDNDVDARQQRLNIPTGNEGG